jgi:putative membrane protein
MTRNLFLLATAAVALAACGNSDTAEKTATDASQTAETAVEDVAQSAPVNAAQDAVGGVVGQATAAAANTADAYVANAAMSDMYEIESSRLALEKSQSPGIKKYAQQMIDDHTATSSQMKAMLTKAGVTVTPPTALDDRRRGMIDNLRAASAADFDRTYVDQQTMAHQEAVTLHSGFAEDGDNPQLKQFATTTAPKVRHHLDMVKNLDQTGADAQGAPATKQ